ncbi:AraC family transcriptional regulator [Chitinophaga sp. HK235]|uniref:helix-turn-helix transcriptional regulator n=1 Tax=Chitinophaga sp. HK235 TaxID=2952571 RepID=UPI001BA51E36|nr:AraC family transcriptional regulator [Chitinophaga sp. HK235]
MKSGHPSPLYEQQQVICEEPSYQLSMHTIGFHQIDLRWASYVNPQEKILAFQPQRPSVVSHFRLEEPLGCIPVSTRSFGGQQFVVYREDTRAYDLKVSATGNKTRSFFELALPEDFFDQLYTEDSRFMTAFRDTTFVQAPAFDFVASITPAMRTIIHDMQHAPYSGHLKGIYLEAKATELFLLQVQQLDNQPAGIKLSAVDIESLYAVKTYLDTHFEEPCTLRFLARMACINQTKLKAGFKALFNRTVFGYLNDLRMEEARRLLQDEKWYVNEVAERMGYQHPHHFTAAFKRKFGVLPGGLRR